MQNVINNFSHSSISHACIFLQYTCNINTYFCVSEEPLIVASQQDITMYMGQTAELRCETSGINPNDVKWSRVGGTLPHDALPRANTLRYCTDITV